MQPINTQPANHSTGSAQKAAQTRHIHRFVVTLILGVVAFLISPSYVRNYIWSKILQHKVLAGFFLLFVVLALTVIWSFGAKLDDLVFLFLNKHGRRSKFTDVLMVVFTQLGNGLFAFAVAGLFYIFGQRVFAFQFLLGTLTLWMVVELAKLLVGRKRPYFVVDDMRVVGSKAIGFSFPSGHTSQAFFMATILAEFFSLPWCLALLLYGLALVTGITRIYLGAHYPKDVIAGAFLGTIWGYFASVLYGFVITFFGW